MMQLNNFMKHIMMDGSSAGAPGSVYGFSQLSALEFLRSGTETCETENHLLRGWCSKCL